MGDGSRSILPPELKEGPAWPGGPWRSSPLLRPAGGPSPREPRRRARPLARSGAAPRRLERGSSRPRSLRSPCAGICAPVSIPAPRGGAGGSGPSPRHSGRRPAARSAAVASSAPGREQRASGRGRSTDRPAGRGDAPPGSRFSEVPGSQERAAFNPGPCPVSWGRVAESRRDMKKSRSVLAVTADEKPKDLLDPGLCSRSYTAGSMLGADLRRGRRRLSSSLQVPPWRPLDRARSPEPDSVQRPTTLPLCIPPRIAITHAELDR
ncbi:uncharacterized protein LOC115642400 [Gopherus evgoodei]|uniref:uncharacterized protein LOC115642400 n=1 Tax=Gopherus evgoodei TaxID=1825980 RepID=UPI0011D018C6|nr:uncharacterized protein LOC115642400 [Gopherus evgoodei]